MVVFHVKPKQLFVLTVRVNAKMFQPLNSNELTNSLRQKGKNTVITDKYLAWLADEVVLS